MNFLKTFRTLEREKLIDLLVLFSCGLFFWTSISSLLPTLPAYIQDMGATAQQVAFVMSFFAIGLLFSRIWLGKLADASLKNFLHDSFFNAFFANFFFKLGRLIFGPLVYYPSRKVVILIGAGVVAIAPICYFFFNQIPQLMAIRAFHGISIAAFTTGYSALVVDLSPPKQKGELIGYMSMVVPLGMAIGPAMGGFLQEYTNYQVLFAVCAGCGLISLILATQVRELPVKKDALSNPKKTTPPSSKQISRSFKDLLLDRSFLVPTLVLLLIGCLFGTIVTFLPLHIRDLGLNFNVGFFYTGTAIASFSVRFFTGRASDRYGRGRFISLSLCLYIIAMILLTFAHSPQWLIVAALFEGAGAGMLIPIMIALISDRCSFWERGKVFSVCVSGFDVGVAVGGAILGGLFLGFGYRFLFAITAFMATIALVIFTAFSNKDISNSWKFAWGNIGDFHAIKAKD